jgi:hypothetical protein
MRLKVSVPYWTQIRRWKQDKTTECYITDSWHQFTHGNALGLIRPSNTPLHDGTINQGNPPNKQITKICFGFFWTVFFSSQRRSGSNFANNCREHHGRPDQLSVIVVQNLLSSLQFGGSHGLATKADTLLTAQECWEVIPRTVKNWKILGKLHQERKANLSVSILQNP